MTQQVGEDFSFDILKKVGNIHNNVSFRKATQSDFDDVVEEHLEELYHVPFLFIMAERATLTDEWLNENPRFVTYAKKICEHFIGEDGLFVEGVGEYLGLRGQIRVGTLYHRIKETS